MSENDRCGGGSERFGWRFDTESGRVWNPQERGCGPIITDRDGEIEERYIRRYQHEQGRGRGGLWDRLGPVEIDGIEIRKHTRIWHDERETWLRASEIDVSEDPEPIITFKIEGTWPLEYVKLWGSDLERLREDGLIESSKEVNDRAESILENFRSEGNETDGIATTRGDSE